MILFSIGLLLQSIWTFPHYLIPKVGAYAGKLLSASVAEYLEYLFRQQKDRGSNPGSASVYSRTVGMHSINCINFLGGHVTI